MTNQCSRELTVNTQLILKAAKSKHVDGGKNCSHPIVPQTISSPLVIVITNFNLLCSDGRLNIYDNTPPYISLSGMYTLSFGKDIIIYQFSTYNVVKLNVVNILLSVTIHVQIYLLRGKLTIILVE